MTARVSILSIAVLLVSVLTVILLVLFPVQNFDIFWHMANGREMVGQGRILNEELFSYTRAGEAFHNHEWLSQLVFYLVYDNAGANGLIALKVSVVLLVFVLLYKTARLFGLEPLWCASLVVLVFLAGITRYTVRPQLFSFLFMSLMGYLFYAVRGGRLRWQYLFVIPPVMVVWDYLHGAVYGIILGSAFLAGETITWAFAKFLKKENRDGAFLWRLWVVALVSLGAMAVNPYGLRTYETFAKFAGDKKLMATAVLEFEPTPLGEFHLFWFLLALAAALSAVLIRRLDIVQLFAVVPFAAFALRYNRVITPFTLVLLPMLAHFTSVVGPRAKGRAAPLWRLGACLVVLACVLQAVNLKFFSPGNPLAFGFGVDEKRLPVGAVRFIKETGLSGNMYNKGMYGGYLSYVLYPERRIFQYNLPAVFGDLMQETQGRTFLDKYSINYALISDDQWSRLIFPPGAWVPVYWDSAATLVVKNTAENRPLLDKYALTYYVPGIGWDWIRLLESSPATAPALLREISNVLSFKRDKRLSELMSRLVLKAEGSVGPEEGAEMLERALRLNPKSAPLWNALSVEYSSLGEPERAEWALEKAVSLDPSMRKTR